LGAGIGAKKFVVSSSNELEFHGILLTGTVPSGKHTKSYGKSQFLMGKLTINGPFSIAMLNYQRVIFRGFINTMRVWFLVLDGKMVVSCRAFWRKSR